jgi:iron(III) transport system substrate-binding protein
VKLMEFLSSAKGQQLYAEVNFEYPLLPGVASSEIVASWGTFTPDDKPLIDIAKLRPAALKLVERVGFDN